MEGLWADLLGHIATFCSDLRPLRLVSKEFKLACTSAKRFGPSLSVNGTVCSLASMRLNGPVFMPYVSTIDLRVRDYLDTFTISDCQPHLEALRLRPNANVSLKIYWAGYEALPWLVNFVAGRTWSSFTCDGLPYGPVKAHAVDLPASDFTDTTTPSQELKLTETQVLPHATDPSIAVRAFATNIKKLVICGLLTDSSIDLLTKTNERIEDLELHFLGCCSFDNIRRIQRVTPNLKRFVLRNSNILTSHLMQLDWSLWPFLETLDLENNFTLVRLPNVPKSIMDLNIQNTGIMSPSDVGLVDGLKRFSCSINSNRWASFFKARAMEFVDIHVTSVDVDLRLFDLGSCPRIDLWYDNRFVAPTRIRALRALWPNSFVRNAY